MAVGQTWAIEPAGATTSGVVLRNDTEIGRIGCAICYDWIFPEALRELAALRQPVDRFFDDVMVMSDDTALRDNRLALLNTLSELFLQVADISLLQG